MPSEYEALVAALKLTDIPFAEYGWNKRPEGTYGVVSLDFEAGSQDGDLDLTILEGAAGPRLGSKRRCVHPADP